MGNRRQVRRGRIPLLYRILAASGTGAPDAKPAAPPANADALTPLHIASITCRIALGPQQGRKVFTLQTLPASEDDLPGTVAKEAGFSLHAGVAARAHERDKVEHLCRYVSRPPVAESRLSLTSNGDIRYVVNGITNVAGAWMRRSDPAEDTVSRRHHARDLSAAAVDGAHPCAPPCGRPAVVQIGCPADLSWRALQRWCRARA